MHRVIPLAFCLLLAELMVSGCGTSSPTTPLADSVVTQLIPPTGQTELARTHWEIDPQTLTATLTPVSLPRQAAQSELFSLSLEEFTKPNTLRIRGINRNGTTLTITYTTMHPFPKATNLAGPASVSNREDLAVTGRVLFLLEGAESYFGGSVIANTALFPNPDGYVQPGEMISPPGLTANTFPYQLLADDGNNNRLGVSNLGDPRGNYNPAGGGWQIAEFGAGITGYDMLGQGQITIHTMKLDLDAIQLGGGLSFDTAILVKYEDPRGGANGVEKRGNRLPSDDVTRFAYRMPHGALDVSAVLYQGETGGLQANTPSFSTIAFGVREWDALATPAATTNLAGESDVSLVSAGEEGMPSCEISIPAFNNLLGVIPQVDSGETGLPGEELYFEGEITNPITSGQSPSGETVRGMVCFTDITDITPPSSWAGVNRFNLRPDLTQLPTVVEGRTFQSFAVELAPETFTFGCNVPPVQQTAPTGTNPFPIAGRITHNGFTMQPHANWQQFTHRALDASAMPNPGQPGVVLQGRSLFTPSNSDFYRFFDPAGWQAERMTNFTATPINQAFQIEVDSTGRVLFCTTNNVITLATNSLKYNQAQANIKYFDWSGTLVTGPVSQFTTAPNIPVAMTLDPDDNVYIIDKLSVLRRYLKASAYAQDLSFPYPILLTIGGPQQGAQGDPMVRNIHDFVINPHNAAFYILAQSNANPATTGMGNGYLYRVECDGSINATTPAGTTNPARFVLNPGNFNDGTGDIMIDYRDTDGNILPNAGDVQIVVVGHSGFGNTEPDIRIFDSELRYNLAATVDFQDIDIFNPAFAPTMGTLDMVRDQLFIQPENSDADYHWYQSPIGWQ